MQAASPESEDVKEYELYNPADYEHQVEINPSEFALAFVQFAEGVQALADALTIHPPKKVRKDESPGT